MIEVYTGAGKGKTTAAIGLAVRALGAGLRVYVMQFMKSLAYSEQKVLQGFAPQLALYTTGKPFFIAKEGMLTAEERAAWGEDVVVFPAGKPPADYLQLMQGRGNKSGDNRQQEISEISRSLKALARELNVPVIALSQLSRSVESRQIKRPMLSDLRESGSIEQDADIVMFLYREDYYNQDTENANITELSIAKHRNGATDTVKMFFQKEYTRFRDLAREN